MRAFSSGDSIIAYLCRIQAAWSMHIGDCIFITLRIYGKSKPIASHHGGKQCDGERVTLVWFRNPNSLSKSNRVQQGTLIETIRNLYQLYFLSNKCTQRKFHSHRSRDVVIRKLGKVYCNEAELQEGGRPEAASRIRLFGRQR